MACNRCVTDDSDAIRRIERDRRKREDELLILLLLLMGRAQHHTLVSSQHRIPAGQIISNIVRGQNGNDGAAVLIAASMADAHEDAVRRVARMAGEQPPETNTDELIQQYTPSAQQAAQAMTDTLTTAVNAAVAEAEAAGQSATDVRRAIRDAFEARGYSRKNAYALTNGAERQIVTAYNGGLFAGAKMLGVVTGLRHASVLDSHTTEICRPRDGLQLPIDDEWWLTNTPSLHFGCRSCLLPIMGDFEPSDWRPPVPPDPGFGIMPVGFIQQFR